MSTEGDAGATRTYIEWCRYMSEQGAADERMVRRAVEQVTTARADSAAPARHYTPPAPDAVRISQSKRRKRARR